LNFNEKLRASQFFKKCEEMLRIFPKLDKQGRSFEGEKLAFSWRLTVLNFPAILNMSAKVLKENGYENYQTTNQSWIFTAFSQSLTILA
jgi:hypothetical protein